MHTYYLVPNLEVKYIGNSSDIWNFICMIGTNKISKSMGNKTD